MLCIAMNRHVTLHSHAVLLCDGCLGPYLCVGCGLSHPGHKGRSQQRRGRGDVIRRVPATSNITRIQQCTPLESVLDPVAPVGAAEAPVALCLHVEQVPTPGACLLLGGVKVIKLKGRLSAFQPLLQQRCDLRRDGCLGGPVESAFTRCEYSVNSVSENKQSTNFSTGTTGTSIKLSRLPAGLVLEGGHIDVPAAVGVLLQSVLIRQPADDSHPIGRHDRVERDEQGVLQH